MTTETKTRAKTYRKAFITVHEARYPSVPEGMTEAQVTAWAKKARPIAGREFLIAVDAIRMVTANDNFFISIPVKAKTRAGHEVNIYVQSPKVTTSWVAIPGDTRYQVVETPSEIRALITEAQRGAAV